MNANFNDQNSPVLNSGNDSSKALVAKSAASDEGNAVEANRMNGKRRESFFSALMRVLSSVSF